MIELTQVTEQMHNAADYIKPHNGNEQTGYMTIMLIGFAFLTRASMYFLDNYDTIFKYLSVISLVLVCLVNAGKLVEQLISSYSKVKALLTHLKTKK